jgi:hypothetical protein
MMMGMRRKRTKQLTLNCLIRIFDRKIEKRNIKE